MCAASTSRVQRTSSTNPTPSNLRMIYSLFILDLLVVKTWRIK
jgi:hypothetical protein